MFGQMKSRPYRKESPCLCKNKCSCHHPRQKLLFKELIMCFLLALLVISPFAFLGLFGIWYREVHPEPIKYIEVKGQMCEIRYKVTSHTSTGASLGHDEAICK